MPSAMTENCKKIPTVLIHVYKVAVWLYIFQTSAPEAFPLQCHCMCLWQAREIFISRQKDLCQHIGWVLQKDKDLFSNHMFFNFSLIKKN